VLCYSSAYARSLDEVTTLPTRDLDFDHELLVRDEIDEELVARDFDPEPKLLPRFPGSVSRWIEGKAKKRVTDNIAKEQKALAKNSAVLGTTPPPPGSQGGGTATPPPVPGATSPPPPTGDSTADGGGGM
jgi:hypothetical protein